MAQIFHPAANSIARASLLSLVLAIGGALWTALFVERSPYTTLVNVARSQPVPFSHQHHVGELGIDCRYCHQTVEEDAFAGIPSAETCMHCHAQIWNDSEMLEPVRRSFATGRPLQWTRVHDLPDYVYFNHQIHVNNGVACVTCHGRVDKMPLTWRTETLHMEWCLECHRAPEKFIRPREAVYDMEWSLPPGETQNSIGSRLVREYDIQVERMTDCSVCHR